MAKSKKRKFKNNKQPVSPSRELQILIDEQKTLQKLAENIEMGNCSHIQPAIFSKLRALVCTGSWTMNPLLQRVLSSQGVKPKFFTSIRSNSVETLDKVILSKLWISKQTDSCQHEVDLDDYLQQSIYYNQYEDRFLTRNDLIRLIADTEGSHFDVEEDLYAASLSNNKVTLGELVLSYKELFMWDMYMLIDWHINLIFLNIRFNEEVKKHGLIPRLISAMQSEVEKVNSHYDPLLRSTLLSFSMQGVRLCSSCKEGEYVKLDDYTFKCQFCDHLYEL
ncbi:hypothetical protein PE36_08016 [Moritella sp. PE36]|uniref:hypothetical protein n=1 Tax=Moritella sp. PE36 TaxID=58051 RepID=UPI0001568C87|nr:hypothetical protein [Moritella sp. PE36]EDM65931.1 hypothetical protein PE36_08016 [Moritella sp. PE36]